MKHLGKKFEDLMAAVSFAEEDEPETAREIMDLPKQVVLVMTGRPSDERPLKYALNVALRNKAGIEALIVPDGSAEEAATRLLKDKARGKPVKVRVFRKSGCIKEAVINHTRKRSDVLCVVAESEEILQIDCSRRYRKLEGIWKELGCPLTLVSQKAGA